MRFLEQTEQFLFHHQKFGLEKITSRRKVWPTASTPVSTQDHKSLFFNTLWEMGLLHCGLGITLDHYQHHFVMCFNLTSRQEAAHEYLHPELTNCSISLDLRYSNALIKKLKIFEIFVWVIRSSKLFHISERKVTKNLLPFSVVCKWMKSSRKFSFRCVNIWNTSFLKYLQPTTFHLKSQTIFSLLSTLQNQILRGHIGLWYTSEKTVIFCRSSRLPFLKYNNIYQNTNQNFNKAMDLMTEAPMANSNSTMCASLSVYISHLGFSTNFNGIALDFVWINDDVLKRFLTHRLSQ